MKLDLREHGDVYSLIRVAPGLPVTIMQFSQIVLLPIGCLAAIGFSGSSWWRTSIVKDIKKTGMDEYTVTTMNSVYEIKRTKQDE